MAVWLGLAARCPTFKRNWGKPHFPQIRAIDPRGGFAAGSDHARAPPPLGFAASLYLVIWIGDLVVWDGFPFTLYKKQGFNAQTTNPNH